MVPIETDDELLRHLGTAARERSRGENLSERELDEKTDEALAGYGEEAFGREFQAQIVSRLRQHSNAREIPVPTAQDASRSRRARSLALAASILLAMSALTWGVLQLTTSESSGALPAFRVSEIKGIRELRSEERATSGPTRVVPGARFLVRLKPLEAVSETPALRVFVAPEDGGLVRWSVVEGKAEISSQGAISIEGLPAEDWQALQPGLLKLYFAVGRQGALPTRSEVEALIGSGKAPDSEKWQLLVEEIRLAQAP